MLYKGMGKNQIQTALEGKGDYVQIDWMTEFLATNPPIDVKKFIFLRLADIYKRKFMYNDAANIYNSAALITIPYTGKIELYLKEAEMHIKSGHFEKVESSMVKAMTNANSEQKLEVYKTIIDLLKDQAKEYEKENKRVHCEKIYEKLLGMKISEPEKDEIKKKLKPIYESLGKFSEAGLLD